MFVEKPLYNIFMWLLTITYCEHNFFNWKRNALITAAVLSYIVQKSSTNWACDSDCSLQKTIFTTLTVRDFRTLARRMNGLMAAGCSVKGYQKDTHNCLVRRWIVDDINNEEVSNNFYIFY